MDYESLEESHLKLKDEVEDLRSRLSDVEDLRARLSDVADFLNIMFESDVAAFKIGQMPNSARIRDILLKKGYISL